MPAPLTSTMRRVLVNLLNGQPMWQGVQTMNDGAGLPAVETSLRKRGLIDHNKQLTRNGREEAEKASSK